MSVPFVRHRLGVGAATLLTVAMVGGPAAAGRLALALEAGELDLAFNLRVEALPLAGPATLTPTSGVI